MKTINMLKAAILVPALIGLLGAGAAEAGPVKTEGGADPAVTAVIQNLKRLYPGTTVKEVSTTPLPGIYQVVTGRNIAFVDDSGRYFIFGHLFDMKEQRDLTQETSVAKAAKVDFSTLPLKDAITTVRGNGSRKLAVFMDPDCPYCQQLENNLAKVTDVTIYTFLFPLEALHPDAKAKAIGVWCAKDRAKAWDDLMMRKVVAGASCAETPLERNTKLAESMGINGTPTIISASGQVVPGSPRPEQLEQLLGAQQ